MFIRNPPMAGTKQETHYLFEPDKKVLECDIINNYGFVHIGDKIVAKDTKCNLYYCKFSQANVNVEANKHKSKSSTKSM